jgi:hypothetical protein
MGTGTELTHMREGEERRGGGLARKVIKVRPERGGQRLPGGAEGVHRPRRDALARGPARGRHLQETQACAGLPCGVYVGEQMINQGKHIGNHDPPPVRQALHRTQVGPGVGLSEPLGPKPEPTIAREKVVVGFYTYCMPL